MPAHLKAHMWRQGGKQHALCEQAQLTGQVELEGLHVHAVVVLVVVGMVVAGLLQQAPTRIHAGLQMSGTAGSHTVALSGQFFEAASFLRRSEAQ